jgi:hypothetical protein
MLLKVSPPTPLLATNFFPIGILLRVENGPTINKILTVFAPIEIKKPPYGGLK